MNGIFLYLLHNFQENFSVEWFMRCFKFAQVFNFRVLYFS